ncbi:MAG: hypothetical protein WBK46_19240 [Ruminococcus flavefaciens]
MNLNQYKVTEIIYSDSKYKLAHPTRIDDEGSFYRIAGTYIIEKHRIKSMSLDEDKLTIHLNDEDVILTIIEKK